MANTKMTAELNTILNPYLYQVVGSTPESIRDSIKNSSLKNNPAVALRLAATCVFAAAVNKSTLENFIAKPELADARPIISTTFSISGRSNMTGLTLLGHCLMTSKFVDDIKFVQEFRKKMGQDHLWAGNLESGSLSDKQKGILKEKKRVTPQNTAQLLGSGFFKYTGVDMSAYSNDESQFWGERAVLTTEVKEPQTKAVGGTVQQTVVAPRSGAGGSSPTFDRPRQRGENITLTDGSVVALPLDVLTYYRRAVNSEPARLVASIEKRGVNGFITDYRNAMESDPNVQGFSGRSVV